MSHRATRKRTLSLVAAGAVAIGVAAGSATAAVVFDDVPESHPFRDEISAVADAGVAGGFPDGTYRPGDEVTRQAMAAFLGRGLGRIGAQEGDAALDTNGEAVTVTSVDLDAGGIAGTGFVHLQVTGDVTYGPATTTLEDCPCTIQVTLHDHDGTEVAGTFFELAGFEGQGDVFAPTVSYSDQAVVSIAGGTSATYEARATLHDTDPTDLLVNAVLTATYVPFGPDGDDTLDHGD